MLMKRVSGIAKLKGGSMETLGTPLDPQRQKDIVEQTECGCSILVGNGM